MSKVNILCGDKQNYYDVLIYNKIERSDYLYSLNKSFVIQFNHLEENRMPKNAM